MSYAPNMEYSYIGEIKCNNTVMYCHADACVKWSPVVLAQVGFIFGGVGGRKHAFS
jgi:hypothetical protein